MDFLPVFMNVKGRHCLVVGAGEIALRKASALLNAGAKVKVVAPEFCAGFAGSDSFECIVARFQPELLEGAALVIAATNDGEVNSLVS